MTDNKRREQIAFDYQQQGTRHRAALQAEALRRAAYEAAADPSYTGHYAGLHPDNRPFQSSDLTHNSVGRRSASAHAPVTFDAEGEYEIEEDDSYYGTRLPTSARRYQRMPIDSRAGSANVVEHFHDTPLRAHRQHYGQSPQLQQAHQSNMYTEDKENVRTQRGSVKQERRAHPLFWIGFFLTSLLLGWMGLNVVTAWFQGVQNDWTYGKQRHFEINAVVGHGDSATNPSHFTAENISGAIIVIELPGGNVNKAKIYQIETVPNNANNPPVKVTFQDMNADGRPDMLVVIGDGSATLYVTLYNNETEFVSKL
jgi:hypothetical protein